MLRPITYRLVGGVHLLAVSMAFAVPVSPTDVSAAELPTEEKGGNFADLLLRSDLRALSIVLTPGGPAGGCAAGYAWNATFGGCRRGNAETQTQTDSCPSGYRGTQTRARSRTGYVLQSNSTDVQYGPWSAWSSWNQSSCVVDQPGAGDGGRACAFSTVAPQTLVLFFRLPGGDPVTNMVWDGTTLVNAPVQSYGVVPGYTARGLLRDGYYYSIGARQTVPGTGSFAEEFYEVCRERA